jgi:hypothetical protein
VKSYHYETSCPECDDRVEALNHMIETATEVTYRTMRRHCSGLLDWARNKGYDRHPNQGLTLKNDWHVGFYKSTFEGRPCYFLRWSAMEFIWVKKE